MVDQKNMNRFSFQKNWPIWLLAAVAVVVVMLMNRHQVPQEETAAVKEGESVNQFTATQEVAAPSTQTSSSPAAVSPSAETISQASPTKKLYTIQVHSFQDQTKAQKSLEALKKAGYTPYVISRDLKEKGIWYRVCVGEFENKEEANTKLAELKQKYKDSFVMIR